MVLPGYSSSPREKVGEGVYMEQDNILANAEPTKKNQNPSPWELGSKVSELLDLGKA